MSSQATDPLEAARQALARHAWQEAFALLKEGDRNGGLSAEDLEGLGEAAWWIGRGDDVLDARERAYAAYLADGQAERAAMVALALARDHHDRLARPAAVGWFKRAERLLEGNTESAAYGWVLRMRGHARLEEGDLDAAEAALERVLEIGMKTGDPDLQAMALQGKGEILIARGRVDEGLDAIDEAMVAAVGGELGAWTTGAIYCNTINACGRLADYGRAGQWTEAANRWCERQSISGFPGICRVKKAEITRLRGAWREAEEQARLACEELLATGRPKYAASGFYELGEIRLRMGELETAEQAFRDAHAQGIDPQPGLALLRLAEGKADAASAMIRRALANATDQLERARLLPAAVEIAVAAADLDAARRAADEMEEIVEVFQGVTQRARAATARGTVELAEGDADGAVRSLRRAWQLWREEDLPYEAARARLLLGRAYRALGDEDAAALEIDAARSALEELGAVPDAWRAADLLREGRAGEVAPRVARTFLFSDIVKSTNLVEAIGDEAWEDLIRWHDQALRARFDKHEGEEIDHAGDGFFVAFPDPRSALECAVGIQRDLAEHRRTAGFAPQVRIGVHAAEATQRGRAFGGKGVHEAARIGALAGGGEIVASEETVRAAGDGLAASEAREETLKGISEPVRVVIVAWR
ncbi:MAG TPA: adenylate/guanylate cyclase domain-containing protein [Actinomycetota bacterium]|nr:adenylate/guanylate cyclase domain-containing protein [Actinomycetota bacterium]